ncbi:MAG: SDR family NAD(P)-dependent oxidoreductase [Planctomycetota bacterium]|nr:SDR family NAD(P)-dependent oxidoreductase [Planctomycetota bacterium]
MNWWQGKRVLITGASDGIGQSISWELDQREVEELVLVARDQRRLSETARRCSVATRIEPVDLSNMEQVRDLLERLHDTSIDVLINNAGSGIGGAFQSQDDDALLKMMHLNCDAVVLLSRELLPSMLEKREGGILFVGSMAGWAGGPGLCAYSATKGFVNRFAEGLRWELAGSGVRICLLAPGVTRTSFFRSAGIDEKDLRAGSLSSQQVARAAVYCIERDRAVVVPGLWNRMLLAVQGWVPRALVGLVSRRMFARVLAGQKRKN